MNSHVSVKDQNQIQPRLPVFHTTLVICAQVSHLHGVDAALGDGSSHGTGHHSLCHAQCLLIATNQLLHLTTQAMERLRC